MKLRLIYFFCKENDGFCDFQSYHGPCQAEGSDCEQCYFEFFIGDGFCDVANNVSLCDFDGGDCVCDPSLYDNGKCDLINNKLHCNNYDDELCLHCLTNYLGDGICNIENYNEQCYYDGNDCNHCKIELMGNGYCDQENDNVVCNFDGEDCSCDFFSFGNGICDQINNNARCYFDLGECETNCKNPGIVGNGFCDLENNNEKCQFDGGDCDCVQILMNDGICNGINNIEKCNFDNGDCKDLPVHCKGLVGNGICDSVANTEECSFDNGDCCQCSPFFDHTFFHLNYYSDKNNCNCSESRKRFFWVQSFLLIVISPNLWLIVPEL